MTCQSSRQYFHKLGKLDVNDTFKIKANDSSAWLHVDMLAATVVLVLLRMPVYCIFMKACSNLFPMYL